MERKLRHLTSEIFSFGNQSRGHDQKVLTSELANHSSVVTAGVITSLKFFSLEIWSSDLKKIEPRVTLISRDTVDVDFLTDISLRILEHCDIMTSGIQMVTNHPTMYFLVILNHSKPVVISSSLAISSCLVSTDDESFTFSDTDLTVA